MEHSIKDDVKKMELLAQMGVVYGRAFTEGALRLMMIALKDITAEELEESVSRLMRETRFIPTVADIIEDVERRRPPTVIKSSRSMTKEEYDKWRVEQFGEDEDENP